MFWVWQQRLRCLHATGVPLGCKGSVQPCLPVHVCAAQYATQLQGRNSLGSARPKSLQAGSGREEGERSLRLPKDAASNSSFPALQIMPHITCFHQPANLPCCMQVCDMSQEELSDLFGVHLNCITEPGAKTRAFQRWLKGAPPTGHGHLDTSRRPAPGRLVLEAL